MIQFVIINGYLTILKDGIFVIVSDEKSWFTSENIKSETYDGVIVFVIVYTYYMKYFEILEEFLVWACVA